MSKDVTKIWEGEFAQQLAEALVSIGDAPTMQKFLSDVMTPKEIMEISARLEAARMLKQGEKYTKIVQQTKLSSRTVARISDWVRNGAGGYQAVLAQLNQSTQHPAHIPPARAE